MADKRTEHMMIRMTPAMKQELSDAADNLGLTRTSYVHMAITYYMAITRNGVIPTPPQRMDRS
jgi:predicted DNA-binding protein